MKKLNNQWKESNPNMNSHEVFQQISATGARIFCLRLSTNQGREETYFVHPKKTTPEWRVDMQKFIDSNRFVDDPGGWASDDVFNALNTYLFTLGYYEVADVVADVFEGRITNEAARLVDDPEHDDIQANGFGHFGHESKPTAMKENVDEDHS